MCILELNIEAYDNVAPSIFYIQKTIYQDRLISRAVCGNN